MNNVLGKSGNIKPYDVYMLIDTNIFFDNFFLEGNKFLALENMTKKTKSTVIMPSIIIDEVKKKYKENLLRQQISIDEINKKCPGMITQNKTVEELVKEYDKFWKAQYRSIDLIDSSKVNLQNLMERSLAERHPFAKESRGFRDALIWESVLYYLNNRARHDNKPLVVITRNKKDFGDGRLFDDLHNELGDRDSYCYSDLGLFLSEHNDRISFINDEYIKRYIEENKEAEIFVENIEKSELLEGFYGSVNYSLDLKDLTIEHGPEPTGYWEIEYYYIRKEDKNDYYVEIGLSVEAEYTIGYNRETANRYGEEYSEPGYWHESENITNSFPTDVSCKVNKKTHEAEPA